MTTSADNLLAELRRQIAALEARSPQTWRTRDQLAKLYRQLADVVATRDERCD